ncbi:MAG: hypothetical protein IPG63_03875 [Xanthomonadales bacterium]|nr:hypothetical protein [Xanthomonadales bacterium]
MTYLRGNPVREFYSAAACAAIGTALRHSIRAQRRDQVEVGGVKACGCHAHRPVLCFTAVKP